MKILVVGNVLLYKDENGDYYSPGIYNNDFLKRYTENFSEVYFSAKVNKDNKFDKDNYIKLNQEKINIVELPWYRGLKGFFKNYFRMRKIFKKYLKKVDLALYRVVQLEPIVSFKASKKTPFILEVVNNPKESSKKMQKIVSEYYLNKMIKKSIGTSYITKQVLQDNYPAKDKLTASYLTNDLNEKLLKQPKKYSNINYPFKLVHVSNHIEGEGKGHLTVIRTVKYLYDRNYDVVCTFIGEGSKVNYFKNIASNMGISNKINFIGRISDSNEMIEELSTHDLFIFPSYSEGLGRVNLEAQLSGLPCLASNVGGIVELFKPEYLFDPSDYKSFGNKIIELLNSPELLEDMSLENHENIKQYLGPINIRKRNDFYNKIKDQIKENN